MLNVSKSDMTKLKTLAALVIVKERANLMVAPLTLCEWSRRESTRRAKRELGVPQNTLAI